MPRDNAGTFTLVAGNPVEPGTVITSTWANNTLDDIAIGITDSLDRRGRGGMLSPFQFTDGIESAPGATWAQEPTTGFYRDGGGDLRVAILAQDNFRWNSNGAQIWNDADSVWEAVLTNGGSDLVPVPKGSADNQRLAWDQTTDQEWKVVAGPAGGDLPLGGAEGETLRWDDTGKAWANTSALIVDDSGNVGIGTALPDTKLEVVSSSTGRAWANAASMVLSVERNGASGINIVSGSGNSGLLYFSDTDAANRGIVGYDHTDNSMYFSTNTIDRMRINAAGNVGIGTASPIGVLDVQTISGNLLDLTNWSTNTANQLARIRLRRANSGTIGTHSGFLPAGRTIGRIDFDPSDGTDFVSSAAISALTEGLHSATDTNSAIAFFNTSIGSTTMSERMRINAAGNVGIGTSDPGSALEVASAGDTAIRVTAGTLTHSGYIGAHASDWATSFAATFTRQYSINATGTLAGLDVAELGVLGFQNGSAGLIHTNGNKPLVFATTSIERMRIDGAGNVGVGTTIPSTKLEVNGDILASGDITGGSDRNLKYNITPVNVALDKLCALVGYDFNWNEGGAPSSGVMANDVQGVLPQLVADRGEFLSMNYNGLHAYLIEAIKELRAMINDLTD